MSDNYIFLPTCDMVGKTIYCSIETDIEDAEFAFYVNYSGERKATFWYSDRPSIEYLCGDEIIHAYEIVFFVRFNGGEIISKSIEKKTSWSICEGILESVGKFVDKNSIILEFGSGMGSKSLAELCTVYSVEHDERFLNIHESVNYIHAPLTEIEPLPEFDETLWYDGEKIRENIPKKIDLVIVDGPPEKYGRSGLLHNLDMFDNNCIWIVDDVLRDKDQKLANYIALKYSLVQYRFWNFSILTRKQIEEKSLNDISKISQKVFKKKSRKYVEEYYSSASEILKNE